MNVKLSIYQDIRRVKQSGKYPIKLRITCQGKQRYYPIGDKNDLTEADFLTVFTKDPRKELRKIKEKIASEEVRAREIIDSLGQKFSFPLFKKIFGEKKGNKNLIARLEDRAKVLRKEGRMGTASLFDATSKSLQEYRGKKVIALDEVDPDFLNEYERHMLKQKRSITTVGIYARNIRTIFNAAILEKIIHAELYPFGLEDHKLYTIPTGRNIKKALSHQDVQLILGYTTTDQTLARAKDFWVFIYLGGGINSKDICLLKFKNIDKEKKEINFERAKTKRSRKGNPLTISFYIDENISRIIKKWGNKSIYEGNYIFPILQNKMTPEEVYKKVQLFTAFINHNMRKVAEDLGIKGKITTYTARHSFATRLVNKGFSPYAVGKAMGHGSTKTTDNYFGNTPDDVKRYMSQVLTESEKVAER
jgi:integrase/recombinase XerD